MRDSSKEGKAKGREEHLCGVHSAVIRLHTIGVVSTDFQVAIQIRSGILEERVLVFEGRESRDLDQMFSPFHPRENSRSNGRGPSFIVATALAALASAQKEHRH